MSGCVCGAGLPFGAAEGWGSSLVSAAATGARGAGLDWIWGVCDAAGVTSESVRERERENMEDRPSSIRLAHHPSGGLTRMSRGETTSCRDEGSRKLDTKCSVVFTTV